MASVNRVTLIGNLTKDPEVKYLPNGDAVTNCTVACSESWKDKTTGEKKEQVEFVRVIFFRKLAEIAGKYLTKGKQVYIEGAMKTRKWEKEGVTHYMTEVVANDMKMLGGGGEKAESKPEVKPLDDTSFDVDRDIPF